MSPRSPHHRGRRPAGAVTVALLLASGVALALLSPAQAQTPDVPPDVPPTARAATAVAERAGGVHTVGGCQVFPADNPWNTRIDDRPVARTSARIIARQAAGSKIHLDLGTTEEYYGIPVNVSPRSQPTLPLRFGVEGENYRHESDRGRVPIRANARIEGWRRGRPNPPGGDRHVIAVHRGRCELIELYKAKRIRDAEGRVVAWRASSAARWMLDSNALRPKGWTSADAAGLPILPGLLDYDEAASGRITHALRFTLPAARNAYTSPARHCGSHRGGAYPAYGMRFRLEKSFAVKRYRGVARTIVVAMKRYGLMYADQGSAMYVTGSADPRWANALAQFNDRPIDGSRFEVVKPGRITVCR